MRKFRLPVFFLTAAMAVIVACGDPIPIKEMVAARQAITKAYSVKADKYAVKELDKAKTELFKAHDSVKNEKMDKAKLSADESYKAAVAAYNKAVPLLAKDTIDAAEQSMNMAVEAYAEELAKTEYAEAKDELAEANKLYENKKFYDAYKKALEADKKAKNARNVALGKKDTLKDAIDEVKATLVRAKKYDADRHSSEKYKLAEENVALAEQSYNDLKLKKGFAAIEVAKLNADEAYGKSLEGSAKAEYANAQVMVEKAKAAEGAEVAKDELAAAEESLANSKKMMDESKYKESIDYSKESVRLSSIVMVTKKPAEVKDTDKEKDIEGKDVSGSGGKDDADKVTKENEDVDYFLYTVVRRKVNTDCLWRIAGRFYKKPRKWPVIYKANKNRIKNPDLIYPGWVLKIPKLK